MHLPLILSLSTLSLALPTNPVTASPGSSSLFTTYPGKQTPLASNYTKVIPATKAGPPGQDDLLFQNLLAAEWSIYTFYQQGVEAFSASNFTDIGFPNTTYERLTQVRDNEAGHVRIFQDQISDTSLKPGPCKYNYNFNNNPITYLALQEYLEVSSMAFLTGLARQANLNASKSALMAIGQVESRHNTWSLIENWKTSPFSGPSDTVYPHANHILELTRNFIIPGSCPSQNPIYPNPQPNLITMSYDKNSTTARPGSRIRFTFSETPKFESGKDYYAVFFHGVEPVSVPFNVKDWTVTIPKFDATSIIIAVIADEKGAVNEDSVIAGPLILLEQPASLTLSF